MRGQGSGLSTCQAEGGPHAPEESSGMDGVREKVGFIENTAMRHRRGGGGEVTDDDDVYYYNC